MYSTRYGISGVLNGVCVFFVVGNSDFSLDELYYNILQMRPYITIINCKRDIRLCVNIAMVFHSKLIMFSDERL